MKRILLILAVIGLFGCGSYDPCEDKGCGDPCTICDPDDADCVETGEFKVCNSQSICTSAAPAICG